MGCGCGKPKTGLSKSFVYTSPTGEKKTYKSEVEAIAAVQRSGGTYRAQ